MYRNLSNSAVAGEARKSMSVNTGTIFILSAPSGCGKTTLAGRILAELKDVVRSISVTTRLPRNGEKMGKDYLFMQTEEFEEMRRRGEFLEWAKVFDKYYGTPRRFVEENQKQGKDILLLIDVQGAMQIKEKVKDSVSIFLLPPSGEELAKRLKSRSTDSKKEIEKRLNIAEKEIEYLNRYDYAIVNDNMDNTVEKLKAVIIAQRCKVRR